MRSRVGLGDNWAILEKEKDIILSVRRSDGLILKVGDTIRTYNIETTNIVRFKELPSLGYASGKCLCYNCDTPYMEEHDANISNVNEVLKRRTPPTVSDLKRYLRENETV